MDELKLPRLLLVDDDEFLRERLALSLSRRNYSVKTAGDSAQALLIAGEWQPDFALVDLKMPGESGLVLVRQLKESMPTIRIVVLTGYGSIASALEAVRQGAADYLTKPADADQIIAAFLGQCTAQAVSAPSLDRVEWEHLQRVLTDCGQNITRTARVLGIDRRSLQRKLAKHPPVR